MKFLYSTILLLIFGLSNAQSDSSTSEKLVYTFAEQNPEFPGGDKELLKIIKSRMQYPQMEFDNHIQGTVVVRFLVNTDGSVSDAIVTRKVSPGLDREAIRLVKDLPLFHPGRQQGKAVSVYYNLPIVFKL